MKSPDLTYDFITKFHTSHPMANPSISHIICSTTSNASINNENILYPVINNNKKFLGQMPRIEKARKSVASFKLRKGMEITTKTTLRRQKIYSYIFYLINFVLPKFTQIPYFSINNLGNGALGIGPSPISTHENGNIIIVLNNKFTRLEKIFILSYYSIPTASKFTH